MLTQPFILISWGEYLINAFSPSHYLQDNMNDYGKQVTACKGVKFFLSKLCGDYLEVT